MIKFALIPLDKTAVFQILEMSEELRRKDSDAYKVFKSTNGMGVSSDFRPKLLNDHINVRGVGIRHDHEITSVSFASNEERDWYIERAKQALTEWVGGELREVGSNIYEVI